MVYLLFFLSGCAGLIYEIAWSRQLGLFFGHTVNAAAVVLGAYFAGMALGYWLAGVWAPRLRRPLAGYGAAELVVALWAVLTPHLLGLFARPQLAALLNQDNPNLQLAVRAVVTFLALLPATTALGATLPFIAQHVSTAAESLAGARRIALAYGLNTAGAFCGVLVATYVLILYVGVAGSGYLAAGISGACGLAALLLARREPMILGRPDFSPAAKGRGAEAPRYTLDMGRPDFSPAQSLGMGFERRGESKTRPESGNDYTAEQAEGLVLDQPLRNSAVLRRPLRPSWYVLAGLSGLGTLGLQVLYTRMFALTFNNSTYTFGGVVAVFLIALACGSWLVARFSARWRPAPFAAYACALGSVAILLGVAFFQRFTQLGYFEVGSQFLEYILGALALIAGVVFIPIALLGAVLPYSFAAAPAEGRGLGSSVGRLTAVNTVCAAIGALGTSFLLLPLLGLWTCFALYAGLYAAAALVILIAHRGLRAIAPPAVVLLALLAAGMVLTHWPLAIVGSKARLLFKRETPYGLITVIDSDDGLYTALRQDNHYTLGATTGANSELRQCYLPLLLSPAPHDVCFLGLATGLTAGGAVDFPGVERITAVELIPEVVQAARYFDVQNRGVVTDPRTTIAINDARHYLYATDRRFDVIVSDLFVPWHSQTGYLYTVEHYRAARRRLAEGGIFCQWLPLYQLGPRELELIADSFASVFPVTTVWRGETSAGSPLLALIGSEQPLELDGSRLQSTWESTPVPWCGRDGELQDGPDILRLFVGRWPAPDAARPLNTDDHPRVEFLAPLAQRDRQLLTGERLRVYYERVLLRLPIDPQSAGIRYHPLPDEPFPDLGSGRQLQYETLESPKPKTKAYTGRQRWTNASASSRTS